MIIKNNLIMAVITFIFYRRRAEFGMLDDPADIYL